MARCRQEIAVPLRLDQQPWSGLFLVTSLSGHTSALPVLPT